MRSGGFRLGRYEINERLGKGGFGVVHLAHDHELGREVAIKFLRPELMTRTQVVQRFLQEARACAKIGHPGIVTVFECGVVEGQGQRFGGTAYIVMELLRGESLGARLKARGKLPALAAIGVARQLAAALQVAHDAGIIHRDLKPDNVYLVKDAAVVGGERVKILDFGVAKLRDPDPDENPHTHSHMMLGTPRYMSPEQARAAARVDHRTDIYALGCLLYELVCGKPPFAGDIGDVLVAHQTQPITPPRELVPSIPAALDELIVRMLAKDPDGRPQAMRDVDAALDGVFGSLAPKQRAKTSPDEERTRPHRPLGPSTDEPTVRLRPSDGDTAQDLSPFDRVPDREPEDHTTQRAYSPPRQVSYETTEPTRGVPPSRRLPYAIGVAALAMVGLAIYLMARRPATSVEPAPASPPAVDERARTTARCAALQEGKRWTELAACGRELAPLAPVEGEALIARATREARDEAKWQALEEALRRGDLAHASALLEELPEDSSYRAAAQAAYRAAKGPIVDQLVGELDRLADCTRHAATLRVAATRYGAKLAEEAKLTARPCTRAAAPAPEPALPTPLEACDRETIDAEARRGDDALSAGSFAVAVVAFERVARCRPEARGKAYLAACRARDFPRAKQLYAALGKPSLAQICIKEGFDPK